MWEYAKKGGKLRKRDVKDMLKIEAHKSARIWEFLERTGAFRPLAPPPPPPAPIANALTPASTIGSIVPGMVTGPNGVDG